MPGGGKDGGTVTGQTQRSPAFQFYPKDWLSDIKVIQMTAEQRGAYIQLLAICWLEGNIPADEDSLADLTKVQSKGGLRVVLDCFNQSPTDTGKLVHPRLEREREKQAEWSKKSSEGGRKSGEARRNKGVNGNEGWLKGGLKMVEPKGNSSSSSSSSFSSSLKDKNKGASALPVWLPKQPWIDFLEMRQRIRKVPTERAKELLIKKLDALRGGGNDPTLVLEQSIRNGWQDVFQLKEDRGGKNKQSTAPKNHDSFGYYRCGCGYQFLPDGRTACPGCGDEIAPQGTAGAKGEVKS